MSDATKRVRNWATDVAASGGTASADGATGADAHATSGGDLAATSANDADSAGDPASEVTAGTDDRAALAGQASRRRALRQLLAVADRSYRVAVRSRLVVGVTAVFAVFSTTVVLAGGPTQGVDAVVATLVELGAYLAPLAGVAVGYDAIAGPRSDGRLALLRALPASRRIVLTGTALGRAGALAGAVLVGYLPGGLALVVRAGPAALGPYATVALAATLLAVAILGIAVLVSAVAGTPARALGGGLLAWLWFVLLQDLVAIALVTGLQLGGGAVGLATLASPVGAYRVLALSPVDVVAGEFGAVMAAAHLSVPAVAVAALAWALAPVAVLAAGVGAADWVRARSS